MPKAINLTGKRFGRLTVVSEAGFENGSHKTWLCKCDCGNDKVVRGSTLTYGTVLACGCYRTECIVARRKGLPKPDLIKEKVNADAE